MLDIERDDVDARHHDVGGGAVVDLQDVADQEPLLRAERVAVVERRLLDHRVDRLAQALAVARPADQPQQVAQARKATDRWFRAGRRCQAARGRSSTKCGPVRIVTWCRDRDLAPPARPDIDVSSASIVGCLGVVPMIEAEQMQHAVHDEMAEMVGSGFFCSAASRATVSKASTTSPSRTGASGGQRRSRLPGRKGQHIGRRVLARGKSRLSRRCSASSVRMIADDRPAAGATPARAAAVPAASASRGSVAGERARQSGQTPAPGFAPATATSIVGRSSATHGPVAARRAVARLVGARRCAPPARGAPRPCR